MSRKWLTRLLCMLVLLVGINSAITVDRVEGQFVPSEVACCLMADEPERFYFDERDNGVAILPRVQVNAVPSSSHRTVNFSRYRSIGSVASSTPYASLSQPFIAESECPKEHIETPFGGLRSADYYIFALRRIVI